MSDDVTEATPKTTSKKPPAPPVGPYDAELANYQTYRQAGFGPNLRQDMGYIKEDDPMYVMNVPADMRVSWATDPRVDKGAHLSLMRGLGYRPVRKEEVTTGFNDADKMVLRAYEIGPHDYVVVGGGVMLIGYRQYHEERRAARRDEAVARLDDNKSRLDNQGVQTRAVSRSGPISEVM
jgi:hypothetical protein